MQAGYRPLFRFLRKHHVVYPPSLLILHKKLVVLGKLAYLRTSRQTLHAHETPATKESAPDSSWRRTQGRKPARRSRDRANPPLQNGNRGVGRTTHSGAFVAVPATLFPSATRPVVTPRLGPATYAMVSHPPRQVILRTRHTSLLATARQAAGPHHCRLCRWPWTSRGACRQRRRRTRRGSAGDLAPCTRPPYLPPALGPSPRITVKTQSERRSSAARQPSDLLMLSGGLKASATSRTAAVLSCIGKHRWLALAWPQGREMQAQAQGCKGSSWSMDSRYLRNARPLAGPETKAPTRRRQTRTHLRQWERRST